MVAQQQVLRGAEEEVARLTSMVAQIRLSKESLEGQRRRDAAELAARRSARRRDKLQQGLDRAGSGDRGLVVVVAIGEGGQAAGSVLLRRGGAHRVPRLGAERFSLRKVGALGLLDLAMMAEAPTPLSALRDLHSTSRGDTPVRSSCEQWWR